MASASPELFEFLLRRYDSLQHGVQVLLLNSKVHEPSETWRFIVLKLFLAQGVQSVFKKFVACISLHQAG